MSATSPKDPALLMKTISKGFCVLIFSSNGFITFKASIGFDKSTDKEVTFGWGSAAVRDNEKTEKPFLE